MLQDIREKFTGWGALAILGTIGVTFIFVGGASVSLSGNNYAAKVDGVDIGIGRFESMYRGQLQNNPQWATLPEDFRLQLRSNILEQLIQQRVIDNYVIEAGYQISDRQLTDLVHKIPDFQVDGEFNDDKYIQVLTLNDMTKSQFEESQRMTMRRAQLQSAIRGSSLVAPSAYRTFLNLTFEKRVVKTVLISAKAVAEDVNVSEEMITAYYDDNPALYQLPETADVEYVEILRSEVVADVSVSEERLLEYYDDNKDRYQQDEQRQARHILILFDNDEAGAEIVANEMLTRVRAGESFAGLAEKYSKDGGTAAQGGDMGPLTRTQLPGELGGIIFSMAEGDIEGPLKSDFGFHIVRLDKILESGPLPFEQVRASLLTELQEQEAAGMFLALERKLSDALFDGSEIRAIAEAVGAEVQTIAAYGRGGGEPFAVNQKAVDAIFDATVLSGAQLSEVIELDANRTAVFAVTQHNLAMRRSFETVRDEIAQTLSNNQSEDLMAGRAQQMLDAVAAGEEFAAAAAVIGAEAPVTSIMARNAEDADQFLAVAIFTALKPTADNPTTGSTRNGTGGYTVYSIESVLPGRPEAIPLAERDAGKLQLVDRHGISDFSAFVLALRANAEVIINKDALAAQDRLQ